MRSLKRPIYATTLGLLITLALTAYVPLAKRTWVRLSGAVMAGGSRTHSYTDKPFRILSVEGRRWVAWDKSEGASAYHALVIFPPGGLRDTGFVSESDGFSHTRTERWQVREGLPDAGAGGELELNIAYDALWRKITFNTQAYRLAGGNMFVIRFDGQRRPTVTQLNTTLDKDADVQEVVGAFKSQLGDDEVARQL